MKRIRLAGAIAIALGAAAWLWIGRRGAGDAVSETQAVEAEEPAVELVEEAAAGPPAEATTELAPATPEAGASEPMEPLLRLRGSVQTIDPELGLVGVPGAEVRLVAATGEVAKAETGGDGGFDAPLVGMAWQLGALEMAEVSLGGLELFEGVVRLEQDLVLMAPEIVTLRGSVVTDLDLEHSLLSVTLYERGVRVDEAPRRIVQVFLEEGPSFEVRAVLQDPGASLWAIVEAGIQVPVEVPLSALRSEAGAVIEAYAAALRVRVVDEGGLALEGAEVLATPRGFPAASAARGRTSASGTADLAVPGGPLELVATSGDRRSYVESLEVREAYQEIEVVLLPLQPFDEVFGIVVLDDGSPAVGAEVRARPADVADELGQAVTSSTVADAGGAFSLAIASNRELELVARLDGRESRLLRVVPGREPRTLVVPRWAKLEVELQTDAIPGPFRPGTVEMVALERRTRAVVKRSFAAPPFALEVGAGEHEIYVLASGLGACGEGFAAVGGQETARALVPLREAGWIAGQVRDAERKVFVDLDVVAYGSWPLEASEVLGRARTDLRGEFHVFTSSPRCEIDVSYAGEVLARVPARARTELEIELP